MPYARNSDLPKQVQDLPDHAKSIFRKAFNAAVEQYDEERAFKIAWAAVKRSYKKEDDKWVAKDGDELLSITDAEFDEKVVFDASSVRKTSNGYLTGEARVARTGIQLYRGWELGDDRDIVRVYRPPEEVFDKASLSSFAHQPMTLMHPQNMVNAKNWRELAIGHLDAAAGREIAEDGEYVRVPWFMFDADAIRQIESGKIKEFSVGYMADISFEDGTTPDGLKYDAIQRGIRVNHLAAVPVARGGPKLRIGDDNLKETEMPERIISCDGIDISLSEPNAGIIARALENGKTVLAAVTTERDTARQERDAVRTERDSLTRDVQTRDGQIAALTQQLKDAELTPQKLDARVAARNAVVAKASKIIGDGFKPDNMTDMEIMRHVVTKSLGEAVAKDLSDAGIEGAFAALTVAKADDKGNGLHNLARGFNQQQLTRDENSSQKAWEDRGQIQRDAWKTASLPQ